MSGSIPSGIHKGWLIYLEANVGTYIYTKKVIQVEETKTILKVMSIQLFS